jgi:hypothetical protein
LWLLVEASINLRESLSTLRFESHAAAGPARIRNTTCPWSQVENGVVPGMIAQGCELKKAGMLTLEPQRILDRYLGWAFHQGDCNWRGEGADFRHGGNPKTAKVFVLRS